MVGVYVKENHEPDANQRAGGKRPYIADAVYAAATLLFKVYGNLSQDSGLVLDDKSDVLFLVGIFNT